MTLWTDTCVDYKFHVDMPQPDYYVHNVKKVYVGRLIANLISEVDDHTDLTQTVENEMRFYCT